MPLAESDDRLFPVLLSVGIFTGALLIFAALMYIHLSLALSLPARRATFALLLLSGCSLVLALLYALSPDTLASFPIIGGALFLASIEAFFTTRFCSGCGRASYRQRIFFQFTHCPYCGKSYDDSSASNGNT